MWFYTGQNTFDLALWICSRDIRWWLILDTDVMKREADFEIGRLAHADRWWPKSTFHISRLLLLQLITTLSRQNIFIDSNMWLRDMFVVVTEMYSNYYPHICMILLYHWCFFLVCEITKQVTLCLCIVMYLIRMLYQYYTAVVSCLTATCDHHSLFRAITVKTLLTDWFVIPSAWDLDKSLWIC